jgi:uncharacterized membrane protein YbaN (DUF454 family)
MWIFLVQYMRRAIRISIGILSIVLGIAGFVLPILQGWLFLALGIMVLSPDIPFFGKLICWTRDRFPRLRGIIDRTRRKLDRHGEETPSCHGDDL